jgi:hypothetical protein
MGTNGSDTDSADSSITRQPMRAGLAKLLGIRWADLDLALVRLADGDFVDHDGGRSRGVGRDRGRA